MGAQQIKKIIHTCFCVALENTKLGTAVPLRIKDELTMYNIINNIRSTYYVSKGYHTFNQELSCKLDGVGPVDNRPSTNYIHHFVKTIQDKKKIKKNKKIIKIIKDDKKNEIVTGDT